MRRMGIGIGVLAVVMMSAGCGGGDSGGDDATPKDATSTTAASTGGDEAGSTEAPKRPDGPAGTFGDELTGGNGLSLLAAGELPDLAEAGYTEGEYPVSGTATGYKSDGELPADGTFKLIEQGSGEYNTRVVVRRPKDPANFNGTVVVEWNIVSSGADVAPDYTYMADEIVRNGYAWVGVSAQHIGIEGGTVAVEAPGAEFTGAGKGLKAFDPARYGDLKHPGDAFSYDIYTQVGRALRQEGGSNPLGDLDVQRLLAVGESQSAFALTTYVNGVQPLTEEFDGFIIHSRGGAAAPLGKPGEGIDIAGTIAGQPTTIRTDLEVPVITVQTESDVLGILDSYPSRQDDNDKFRLWEIAGTAHADYYQLGATEELLKCPKPINRGQQSFVLKAALRQLEDWAKNGEAPPKAARLDVDSSGAQPVYKHDDVGNVTGGVRTPAVEAPVDVLSGLPAEGANVICMLMGSTTPIPPADLARMYDSPKAYDDDYATAADAAIDAKFVLEDDREALIAEAQPDRIAG